MRLIVVLRRMTIIGTVLVSSASLLVGQAEAAPVAITIDCSQAIGVEINAPGSYELQRGVRECGSEIAIEISASDVSLNLDGRIIDGVDSEGTIGVSASVSNVRIRNGTVSDFDVGVGALTAGVEGHEIRQIVARSNEFGVLVRDGATITGCTVLGSEVEGISGGDGNTVIGNVVSGSERGISVFDGNTITGNRADGAVVGISAFDDNTIIGNVSNSNISLGITAHDHNVIKRNTAIGNGRNGINVNHDNTIRANRTNRNLTDGIVVRDPDATTTLRDNVADRNSNFGIKAGPGVVGAGTNSASGNGNVFSQCDPADLCV